MADDMKQIKQFFFLSYEQKSGMNSVDVLELLQVQLCNNFPKFLMANPISFNLIVSNDIGIEVCLRDKKLLKWHIYTDFIGDIGNYNGKLYNLRIENATVPAILTRKSNLYTFWNDKLTGFKTLLGWLMRSFNIRFEILNLKQRDKFIFSGELRSIINFVNYRQNGYIGLAIDERSHWMKQEDLDFVIGNTFVYKQFSLLGSRTVAPSNPKNVFKVKHLLISHANWFTVDHLLETRCRFVTIVNSHMNNSHIYTFIRQWMRGKFPQLKHIKMKLPDVRCSQFLNSDIPRVGYIRGGVYRSENDKLVPIRMGVVIQNHFGTQFATIMYPRQPLPSSPNKLIPFEMVVWPDWDGLNFDRNVIFPQML